jgi:dihydrofolate reductase
LAKLIYSALASLDGYIEDEGGNFDWAEPDEEVHTFINDLDGHIGTYLLGRRMYEVMVFWEDATAFVDQPRYLQDFAAIWRGAQKVVFSRTLDTVSSASTRIERNFDPEAVRAMKTSSDRDLSVAGPDLAAHAFRAGLVDEYHLFLAPVIVGGGKSFLPKGVRTRLELLDERRFSNGMVFLRHRVI